MAVNQWVEEDYYVGEDGAMVQNAWVKTLADDEENENPDDNGEHWYYFDSKGKRVAGSGTGANAKKKTINGKTYFFDGDGRMMTGWFDDGKYVYYLGSEDEGWAAKSRWLWLEKLGNVYDSENETDNNCGLLADECLDTDSCDDEGWYWFDASGHMERRSGQKTINGRKFVFNEHGQMLYEWIYNTTKVVQGSNAMLDDNISEASEGKISVENMLWFQENGDGATNGARLDGWQFISGSKSVGTDGDTNWYYFKKGEAKHADSTKDNNGLYEIKSNGSLSYQKRMKTKLTWSGKTGTFCFDQNGKMKTGLQLIGNKTYFFDDDGYMKTGKVANVEEADNDTFAYYFDTKGSDKGRGYTGVKDGILYMGGKRLEASDDNKVYYVQGEYYLVNSKGRVQKSGKKKVELLGGGVEEDCQVTVSDRKSGKLTSLSNVELEEVAEVPHIQLEDTDNFIIENGGKLLVLTADDMTEAGLYNKDEVTIADLQKLGLYADAE